jgi:hypothetical protein
LPVQAEGVHVHGEQCGYNSNYDVRVTAAGIDFSRGGAQPNEIFMHDGALRVDGRPVAVSADDAARLRSYEGDMRSLLPEMAGIAHEAVGIAFDALATVAATLGGSQHHRDALVRQLNQSRMEALRGLEASINADHWSQQDFADAIEQPVTEASNQLASSLTRSVMWSLFTGRAGELEARADSVDQSMEKRAGDLSAPGGAGRAAATVPLPACRRQPAAITDGQPGPQKQGQPGRRRRRRSRRALIPPEPVRSPHGGMPRPA